MSRPASERPRFTTVISHLGVMVLIAAVLGVVVSGLAIPFAGLLGYAAHKTSQSVDDLPKELRTDSLPQRTTIEDANGNVIAQIFDQNRINVTLDQVSPLVQHALLSIEDYRFYEHGAIDLKGTLRAFVTNQSSGGVVQGGSTITQQLVKQTLLEAATTAKERAAVTADSYARKLNELRYAIALEKAHSKNWILERYLNTVYFGDGAYGIQAAAKHYYNVNASDLDLDQSATLAGLVQNPSAFDPTNYPDRAKVRRNVVLDRMAQLSVITHHRAKLTKKKGLELDTQTTANGCVNTPSPFFCSYAISYLEQDRSLGATLQDRKELLYSGGLTIKTTLDQRFQRAADHAVTTHVYPNDQAIGALAMVKPGTGDVKALSQSRPMGSDAAKGQTYLNYVVPKKYGDANGFQAGSTFKLFVLSTAINQGIPLTTQINSPDTLAIPEDKFKTCDGYYPSSQDYLIHNSTGAGTFNLYTGTQQSVNTFFGQLEERTGLCEPYHLAQAMGVPLNDPATQMVPSFTLGVADVNPLTMAGAYATVAARGLYCAPRPVTEIDDAEGRVVKTYPPQCTQVMPHTVADAVNSVLKGVQEPGGFGYEAGISLAGHESAGKTGTTNDNAAVWFDGYTPALATVAMVAGANKVGSPVTLNDKYLGPNGPATAHGSTTAGPIWGEAMDAILKYLPPTTFHTPSSTDVRGVLATVPDVTGKSQTDALNALSQAGFTATVGGTVHSAQPAGQVVSSAPTAGNELSPGDPVSIYISDGKPIKVKHSKGKHHR